MVVSFVLYHLRSHVLEGSTECVSLLAVVWLHAPPEITNLDDVTFFNEDILWLNISMDQALFVHVVDTRADLNEKVESCVLTQVFLFTNQVEQITFTSIL